MIRNNKPLTYFFKLNQLFFFIIIISIFFASARLQSNLLLNHDVGWLLEAAKRLLAGGSYTQDFFENNPPLILYLYYPPVITTKLFSISIIDVFRYYIFLLAALSLVICHFFIRKIFSTQDAALSNLFTIMLAMVMLIYPMTDFGQREHLLVILSMPYFLLMSYKLQANTVSLFLAAIIGLLAGLAFAIKPYFLAALLLVEIYFVYSKRSLLASLRTENFVIAIILFLYSALIIFRHADYLFVVMPYALKFCYFGTKLPWRTVLIYAPALFCIYMVIFYIMQRHDNPYKKLGDVLVVAMVGFLISYAVQRVHYAYHFLPAISLSLLIAILSLKWYVVKAKTYILISLMLICFIWFHNFYANFWVMLVFNPVCYFIYFTGLFILLLYLFSYKDKRLDFTHTHDGLRILLKIIICIICIIAIGYQFSFMTVRTSWHAHSFGMTTSLLIAMFIVCFSRFYQHQYNAIAVILIALVLSFPYYFVALFFLNGVQKKEKMQPLINFLQIHAVNHPSFYFLSTSNFLQLQHNLPETKNVSRFSSFWMLPAILKKEILQHRNQLSKKLLAGKNFMIDMVASDLAHKQPDFVFVDVSKIKKDLVFITNNGMTIPIPFDYINYFSQNQRFAHVFKNYHYLTTLQEKLDIAPQPRYKYRVFVRNNRVL